MQAVAVENKTINKPLKDPTFIPARDPTDQTEKRREAHGDWLNAVKYGTGSQTFT